MTLPGCNKTTTRHGADMPGSAPVNHLELLNSTTAPAPETMMCVAKSGLPRPVAIDGIGELTNEFRQ